MFLNLDEIFAPGGGLSRALANYESRPQQVEMAKAVARAIEERSHLLVEAGTGTGKTLAYLIPFIVWAVENSKKVLISTYTKTLQQQLIEKDIPLLRRALSIEFRHALCLGTQNYLCPKRLERVQEIGLFENREAVAHLKQIQKWARWTETGLRQELDFEPDAELWNRLCCESDYCRTLNCREDERSFYWKARRVQLAADLLVANHHLFFANLAAAGNVLPKFDAIVLDEAHNIESVAAEFLGVEVSNTGIHYLLDRIFGRAGGGLVATTPHLPQELVEKIGKATAECRWAADEMFQNLLARIDMAKPTYRIREAGFIENLLEQPLLRLQSALDDARKLLEDSGCESEVAGESRRSKKRAVMSGREMAEELSVCAERLHTLRQNLHSFLAQESDESVYWVEVAHGHRTMRVSLHIAPVDISATLQAEVFDRFAPVVLTSATLTHNHSFQFIQQRLGLFADDGRSMVRTATVGSPFDYREQALLYIADDLPEPRAGGGDFEQAAVERALQVVKASGGRAFVLCTSHQMVNRCAQYFAAEDLGFKVFCQGDKPRERLLEDFNQNIDSVLIGTQTFWQGIDIPGEALQCVVLTKLPFAVPDDPLIEARMERLQEQGRDPFYEYQVPHAILLLRQGFGRLIRHRDDFGVVAILDPRIVRKPYGRLFFASLPDCRQTTSLEEVARFLHERRNSRG